MVGYDYQCLKLCLNLMIEKSIDELCTRVSDSLITEKVLINQFIHAPQVVRYYITNNVI
jgi:hypothetical protein